MAASDLIPFVAVLAAAVTALSTLAGIRLANRAAERQLQMRLDHDDQKLQKEALRARLEELYQLIHQWSGSVVGHYVLYRKVMEGQITYNQALDVTINSSPKADAARLFTLADLYFPKCHDLLSKIRAARDRAARIEGEFKELYRHSGTTSAAHADALTEALTEFDSCVDAYRLSLAEYAREV